MKLKITVGLAVLAVVGGVSAFLLRSDRGTATSVSPVGTPPRSPTEPEDAPEPGPLALALPPAPEPAAPAAAEEPAPADELEALIEDQGKGATPRLLKVVGDPEQPPELRNMAIDSLCDMVYDRPHARGSGGRTPPDGPPGSLGTFKDPESKATIESLARASDHRLMAAAKTSLIKYGLE